MRLRAFTRRFRAGIATFAMLLASLAPAVTSAIAAADGRHVAWTAVCTADGARLVPVPTDADGVPLAPGAHHADHCPFCSPHGGSFALPPPAALVVPLVAGAAPLAPAIVAAPRPFDSWVAAQPRAPPSFS